MTRSLSRVSFGLVVLATAVVTARWVSVVSAQPMGMYALYDDWDAEMETGDVFGFGSTDELDTGGCFHSDYRTWLTLASPSRVVDRVDWALGSSETMPWNQEEGTWRVSHATSYFCNCGGGGQSAGTGTVWFSMSLPHWPDPAKLQECNTACENGQSAIENFCRSLPPFPPAMKVVKLACWANRWSKPLCRGICYAVWGDW